MAANPQTVDELARAAPRSRWSGAILDFIRRRRYSDNLRIFVVTNGTPARFSHVDREAIAGVLTKPLDAVCVERAIAEA